MTDPVFQDDNQQTNSSGIFWGSDDIFENEDMFQPINKKDEEEQNKWTQEPTTTTQLQVESNETLTPITETSEEGVNENQENPTNLTANISQAEQLPIPEEENNNSGIDLEKLEEVHNTLEEENMIQEDTEEYPQATNEENTNETTNNPNFSIEDIPEVEELTENSENKRETVEETSDDIEENNIETTIEENSITESDISEKTTDDEKIAIPSIAPITIDENLDIAEGSKKDLEIKENKEIDYTPLQESFYKLLFQIKEIYTLKNLNDEENFQLIQWENIYTINLGFNTMSITKTIDDQTNELKFQMESKPKNTIVSINGEILYNEEKDLQVWEKNTTKVQEKIKKFIVLVNEEKETLEQEQKNEKLKGVFRDF